MIKSNKDNDIDIILIDYECSHKLRFFLNTLDYKVGTLDYCAPEILQNQYYTSSSDIWSIGICLLKLLLGDNLYFKYYENYKLLDIKKNLSRLKNYIHHFFIDY